MLFVRTLLQLMKIKPIGPDFDIMTHLVTYSFPSFLDDGQGATGVEDSSLHLQLEERQGTVIIRLTQTGRMAFKPIEYIFEYKIGHVFFSGVHHSPGQASGRRRQRPSDRPHQRELCQAGRSALHRGQKGNVTLGFCVHSCCPL